MSTFRNLLFRHGGGKEWEGEPPLTLTGATSAPATNYKIYGSTVYNDAFLVEYTPLQYVTFNNCYIDTGIYLNSQTKIDLSYSITNTKSGGQSILGGRTSASNNAYNVFSELTGTTRYNYNNQNTTGEFEVSTNTLHRIVKEAEKNYFDDQTDTANTAADFTCEYTAYIGACNSGGTASLYSAYTNLYELKIYNGDLGELTNHYIPVKRNDDSEVGLYDTVNGIFHNKDGGTGSINAGPVAVLPTPDNPVEMISVGDPILPSGYQQLEYVEVTEVSDSSYIDTGLYGNLNTRIEIDLKLTSVSTELAMQVMGDITTSTSAISMNLRNASGAISRFGSSSRQKIFGEMDTNRHVVAVDRFGYELDGVIIKELSTETEFTTTDTLLICSANTSGSHNSALAKYYEAKIYSSGVLVFHGIPAKRLNDNAISFYDLVSNTFIPSSGDSVFTAGPAKITYKIPVNVSSINLFNSATAELGYLKSDGSTTDNNWSHSDYIPVKAGNQYSLKLTTYGSLPRTCWYDSDQTLISSSSQAALLTVPSGAVYARISVKNTDLAMAMFVKGSTAPTSYIPYYNTTTTIYLDAPLRQIISSDGLVTFTDYIDYGNQKVVRQVGNYIASSSDTWVTSSGSTGNTYARVDFTYSYNPNTETELMCNYYATGRRGVTTSNNTVCAKTTRNGFLFIDNANATDIDTWKAFVDACVTAGTPIEVYYPLETATETAVTLPSITLTIDAIISVDTTVNASNLWIKQ